MTPTRELWLRGAVQELREPFRRAELPLPEHIHVSVGWPSRGALGGSKTIGECWYGQCSVDGNSHVFISPLIGEPVRVLDILVHELVHVALGPGHGHRGKFSSAARKMGLEGKPTATVAGPELTECLQAIADRLGEFPHSAINPGETLKPQTTRMLKLECPDCGYIVRTTAKWLEVGVPTCHCGTEFAEAA